MRTATTRVGATFLLATALAAASQTTATADPPPAEPNVQYTLTSQTGVSFNVNYITAQPASLAAFNADAYSYLKKEEVPTADPWVFKTTLNDTSWAFVDMSAAAHGGQAPPYPHCEIAVNGQVVSQAGGDPYTARCSLGKL
jgi:hypothetical protein